MTKSEEIKDKLYEALENTIEGVPKEDKLILLGDVSARMGTDNTKPGRESLSVCEVGTVGKISDRQPGGPGFNSRPPGRGLNFGQPSFATPSVDRDVKPLV